MAYNRINWENDPSTATPLNETNLNKMDKAIYDLDREKMNNVNPSGTGKFSMNRKIGSTEGTDSVAIGPDSVASTTNSMAFGLGCESNNENQVITGVYPTKNISNAVFAVGCGKNDTLRLTAFWVTSNGELKSNYNITGKVGGNEISLASLQAGKQNVLTFDNVPTDGSNNPVRSNGIYDALAEKADKDGFINGSMKLVSGSTVLEKVPYNLRASGGKAGAVCQNTDKIVGGTIAWNQIFTNGNFADTSDWSKNYSATQFSVSGNVGTVVTDRQDGGIFMNIAVKANHKYFFSFEIKNTDKVKIGFAYISGGRTIIDSPNTSFVRYTQVGSFSSSGNQACCFYSNVATANTLNIRNCMIVDLTQLMNDVISDKDTFVSMFPKTYYAYDTGTLMSVNTSAHKMTGKNLCVYDDESTFGTSNCTAFVSDYVITMSATGSDAFIGAYNTTTGLFGVSPCVEGASYKLVVSDTRFTKNYVTFLDDSNNIISASKVFLDAFTVPSGATQMGFRIGYDYTTSGNTYPLTIMVVESSVSDTIFEPYTSPMVVNLDSTKTLRGIYKLDANNDIYCDGDTYESNGTVTRKYAEVDMGSLDYVRLSSSGGKIYYMTSDITDIVVPADTDNVPAVCAKFVATSYNASWDYGQMAWFSGSVQKLIFLSDGYSSANEFKTAMTGTKLIYKLATATTETANGFTNPQLVDANGTEEYVDYAYSQNTRDVKVPVGHDSNYNQALELPALPSSDGTYSLKCTRSGGSVSFSWV